MGIAALRFKGAGEIIFAKMQNLRPPLWAAAHFSRFCRDIAYLGGAAFRFKGHPENNLRFFEKS
ncbi:MAG TPA: hypothetical protein VIJ62_06820 [Rhizomicrobium sp.]